jgi:pilus assembly protein CpaB
MGRKWSPTSKLFAALSVVFGVAAFLVVRGYSARVQALAPTVGRPVDIVVAARDLARGTRLTADMLREVSFPSSFVPPGALPSIDRATGRTLVADMREGEPVTVTRFAEARAGPVAALVPEGLRAFAVATALPPGSVRPGDHVDVLGTFASGRRHTETVADDVEVVAVLSPGSAGSLGGPTSAEGGQTLLLLVSPDGAESLASARAFGDLTVTIEPPGGP